MFGGFQNDSFQNNAFQIVGVGQGIVYGGGGYYDKVRDGRRKILERERLERERLEAKRSLVQKEIDNQERAIRALEQKRLDDLANEQLQLELLALLTQLNALEIQRQRITDTILMFMREEDDLMAILYCIPFLA